MQKEDTPDILETLERKHKIRKLLVIAIISVLIVIIVFLVFSFYQYYKTPERTLGLGANIESVLLSEDGKTAFIKLRGGSLDKNITKVKFIFIDKNKTEYYYETNESVQNISVYFKRSFLGWLLRKPKYEGKYDYEINASSFGFDNFYLIEKVDAFFAYKTEQEEEKEVKPPITEEQKSPVVNFSNGGGGRGDGGGGNEGPSCTNDEGCSSTGIFCEGNMSYNCASGADGCLDKQNIRECNANETCIDGEGCVAIKECTTNENCTHLSGECGTGLCNLTTNKCEIAYNSSTTICRESARECDEEENCTGISAVCRADKNKTDGTACFLGFCQTGKCIPGFCANITQCYNYTDPNNCINDTCNVGYCEWNSSLGQCVKGAGIELTGCQVIDSSNTKYFMTRDISQLEDNSCIIIFAENVTLDCQGHSVTSSSISLIAGIYSNNPDTTIKNCIVTGIVNGWGIYLTFSNNSYLYNNRLNNNKYGLQLNSSSHNTLVNNIVNNNGRTGIYLYSSSYNNLTNNTANNNFYTGLYVVQSILGNDTSIGNNINGNEFCLNGGSKDVFCMEDQTFTNNYCCCDSACGGTCLTCPQTQSTEVTECKKLIMPNTEYKQMNDLIQDKYRDCITIAAENITYDCQGYSITRSVANATNGIYSEKAYTTIKNCNIEMGPDNVARFGIYLDNTNHSKLINNNFNNNWLGIYVWRGKGIEIIENNIINSQSAMQIQNFVLDIKIINNTIINSSYAGIQFNIINYSLVDNNLIENCGGDGMQFMGMYNNITNNIINSTEDGIMVHGLSSSESRFNRIINNTVTFGSGNGIYIFSIWAKDNEVINNTSMYNKRGLELFYLQNNITGNSFCSNTEYDVYCRSGASVFTDNKCDTNEGCGGTCAPCGLPTLSFWQGIIDFFKKLFVD